MKHRLARWLWVHDVGFNIGLRDAQEARWEPTAE